MRAAVIPLALMVLFAPQVSFGQPAGSPWENMANLPVSPEVHPDKKVTFRLYAPKATEVQLIGATAQLTEALGGAKPLKKDEKGVWSVTIGPLQPGFYSYGFAVDGGLRSPDPANPSLESRRWGATSFFTVPGDRPFVHEVRAVPHGTV